MAIDTDSGDEAIDVLRDRMSRIHTQRAAAKPHWVDERI